MEFSIDLYLGLKCNGYRNVGEIGGEQGKMLGHETVLDGTRRKEVRNQTSHRLNRF